MWLENPGPAQDDDISVCHVLIDTTVVGSRRTYKILVSNHIHKEFRLIIFSYVYHFQLLSFSPVHFDARMK